MAGGRVPLPSVNEGGEYARSIVYGHTVASPRGAVMTVEEATELPGQ